MGIWQLLNVSTHIFAGSLILLLGVGSLLTEKGSSRHKWFGRYFLWGYSVVLFSAIIGVMFFRSPPALAAVTLAATYGFVSGYRSLRMKHYGPGALDQSFALIALALCGYFMTVLHSGGSSSWPPAMGYSTISIVSTYALYDVSRVLWRKKWVKSVWPIDHGVKMVGAYFAAASAASGNILRDFQPWSQVMPSVIGTVITLWLVYRYIAKRRVIARLA
ncbi:hypothetical protein QWI17_20475 [Gilvimarinus sp. SDUM040013]|uniref:DUF2306 domain-containing protein n=1 Tax=Gilvimarinus gilvus TaxID=3058038 RepID=A0ABU4RSC0_9GAMM|nr:hypothetical protein [Gilvimarinus sp. SDUM040013]MDO3388234.1 hypothetical protein [Gilvimarinus sp. SDUM040013]MDX6847784.1 hypothetical protein [Gilvimarinus sp. SDUM040013]